MRTSLRKGSGGFALSSMLALVLWLLVSQVEASSGRDRGYDGGRDRGYDRGYERSDWRLGEHNQILMRTDRGWRRVPGAAIAVGDGWVIGTDRRSGGYGIYRWNGRQFDRMPGGAVQIGGSYRSPWVINNRGQRFEWTGRDWREVRGAGAYRDDRRDHRHPRGW